MRATKCLGAPQFHTLKSDERKRGKRRKYFRARVGRTVQFNPGTERRKKKKKERAREKSLIKSSNDRSNVGSCRVLYNVERKQEKKENNVRK